MNFNFDWSCVSSGAPYVTISKISIGVNTPAIELLGKPEYVMIGFDSEQMTIGIKPYEYNSDTKNRHKFADRIKDGWVRIGCKDFIKYLSSLTGIEFAPAIKYVANFDKAESLLYVKVEPRLSEVENI